MKTYIRGLESMVSFHHLHYFSEWLIFCRIELLKPLSLLFPILSGDRAAGRGHRGVVWLSHDRSLVIGHGNENNLRRSSGDIGRGFSGGARP